MAAAHSGSRSSSLLMHLAVARCTVAPPRHPAHALLPGRPLVLVSDFFLGFAHRNAAGTGIPRVMFHDMLEREEEQDPEGCIPSREWEEEGSTHSTDAQSSDILTATCITEKYVVAWPSSSSTVCGPFPPTVVPSSHQRQRQSSNARVDAGNSQRIELVRLTAVHARQDEK